MCHGARRLQEASNVVAQRAETSGGRPDDDTERGRPATDPRRVPKDRSTLAPGTGKLSCSAGDIDDAKGLVLRRTSSCPNLALMRALIAFLSQWAVVLRGPPCIGSTALARSLTMSAVVQTAGQDLTKRFHFGSKQFDRHLGKLICRIGNQKALSLHQIGPRLLKRAIKSLYLHL